MYTQLTFLELLCQKKMLGKAPLSTCLTFTSPHELSEANFRCQDGSLGLVAVHGKRCEKSGLWT